MAEHIEIYIYPNKITPKDKLTDGAQGEPFEIAGDTLLIWVDRQPGYRFVHPTSYILISEKGVQAKDGGWYPILNGKRILCEDQENPTSLIKLPVQRVE